MVFHRSLKRVLPASPQASSIALIESFSETRISILYLARQAKEAKNNALAKELTVQGQTLRAEIARLRRTWTTDWDLKTKILLTQGRAAQSELARLMEDAEKSAKKTRVFTRAIDAVTTLLALTKKIL